MVISQTEFVVLKHKMLPRPFKKKKHTHYSGCCHSNKILLFSVIALDPTDPRLVLPYGPCTT